MRIVVAAIAAMTIATSLPLARGARALLAQAQDPSQPPARPPSVAAPQPGTRPSFSDFLAGLREEAIQRGFKVELVDRALSSIEEPLPVVLERDRTQAETVLSLESYLARWLTPKRVRTGREMLQANRELLTQVSERYHVPPSIIVSIWGIESDYGRLSGIRPTIAALATLAWDPRRSALFRNELFHALEIVDHGDIDLDAMKGSWAGAMGQPQFMPSSYLKYAEDFDGDGRRDIWASRADVFASIANYLVGYGWTKDEIWGREVKASPEVSRRITNQVARRDGSCRASRDMTVALPIKQWQGLGIRLPNGRALPSTAIDASLVSGTTRRFLVYHNYDALLGYNCANAYALGVALLADRIASPKDVEPEPAKTTRPAKTKTAPKKKRK